MIEFGEKIKRLREEKGMTQQTMAERLYVTRQAVSRWECGARYPDLLTTKKIAEILEVSIDELVSGEELKRDVEKEPVLMAPVSNFVQTILYTIAAVSFGIMLITVWKMYFPDVSQESAVYTWADWKRGLLYWLFLIVGRGVAFAAMLAGIYLSVRNELSPGRISGIMSAVIIECWFSFLGVLVLILPLNGGERLSIGSLLLLIGSLPALFCINYYFRSQKKCSPVPVYLVGAALLIYECYHYAVMMVAANDSVMEEGFAALRLIVLLLQMLGKGAVSLLMIYQAYALNKKRQSIS